MTVAELIADLSLIEDKSLPIYAEHFDKLYHIRFVFENRVFENDPKVELELSNYPV